MNGANRHALKWKQCIWEATKQNRNMCGVQDGMDCWIPTEDSMTPETVINRSQVKLDKLGGCKMGGDVYNMHLYSWSDETKNKIATGIPMNLH